jgi:hypothetical protein
MLSGFLVVYSMFFAAFASLLYWLIERTPQRWLQIAITIVVAAFFIAGERPINVLMYSGLGANEFLLLGPFISIIQVIPLACILSMAIILPFLLIREHLCLKRAWAGVFFAGTIAVTMNFFQNLLISSGPNHGTSSAIYTMPYIDIIYRSVEFFQVFVAASAVFGAFIFLQHINVLAAGHPSRRGILAASAISLLVFLPAAGIGGLSVYIATLLGKFSGRLAPMALSLAAMIAFAIAGSLLMGISGMDRILSFFIIATIVMAFAVVVPFSYFAPGIGKIWQPVILLAGAAAADLVLTAIAVLLDLGGRLTSDPLTVLTFAEGEMILSACSCFAAMYLVRRYASSSSSPAGEVSVP